MMKVELTDSEAGTILYRRLAKSGTDVLSLRCIIQDTSCMKDLSKEDIEDWKLTAKAVMDNLNETLDNVTSLLDKQQEDTNATTTI